jgi:hypothetical protein
MIGSTARLVVAYGSAGAQEFLLTAQTTTLGRETINDIVLKDPEVSRRHIRFTQMAGRFVIEDLGSTNGTFLNGRRISAPSPLLNGDVIDLGGSLRLTFFGPPGAAEATVIEQPDELAGAVPTALSPEPGEAPPQGVPTAPVQDGPMASPAQGLTYQASTAPSSVPPPYVAPEPGKRDWQRYAIGCGCLVILGVIACGATTYLLDRYAWEFLYCGPLQFIFEAVGFNCP